MLGLISTAAEKHCNYPKQMGECGIRMYSWGLWQAHTLLCVTLRFFLCIRPLLFLFHFLFPATVPLPVSSCPPFYSPKMSPFASISPLCSLASFSFLAPLWFLLPTTWWGSVVSFMLHPTAHTPQVAQLYVGQPRLRLFLPASLPSACSDCPTFSWIQSTTDITLSPPFFNFCSLALQLLLTALLFLLTIILIVHNLHYHD